MPSERFIQAVDQYKEKGGTAAYRKRRLRCQTDLWFLSKEIFHRDLFERTHRPIVDFFLKKEPFRPAFVKDSQYGLAEFHDVIAGLAPLERRKGLLLYPRGTFKSSINADDITQYIICYPDIRILILVGEGGLGEAFVPDIKQRFVLEKDAEPTEFQLLFPEFVIDKESDKDRGGANEYWCPVRRLKQKEPTLGWISILGATSGWHCDVLKPDDMVNDTTPVETSLARGKVLRKFMTVINMLDPHGILEVNGTCYHEDDAYQHMKSILKQMRYLHGASWTPLPHAKSKKLKELTEQDVLLLFPERQPFNYLREKLLLDEKTFCLQQLNDPTIGQISVTFRIEDLRAATTRVPENPSFKRYNFWDVATSDSEGSDFCVGGFVSIDSNRWIAYLHTLVVDKFTPDELALQIAQLAKQTVPEKVFFEKYKDSAECWLEQEVKKHGLQMGYEVPIYAFKTDKTKLAKGHRICGLEPLIRGGRLWFSNLIPNIDILYKHFTEFKGIPHPKRHDDIPDMLSFLRMVMPMVGLEPVKPFEKKFENGLSSFGISVPMPERTDAATKAFLDMTAPQPMTAPVSVEGYFPGQ